MIGADDDTIDRLAPTAALVTKPTQLGTEMTSTDAGRQQPPHHSPLIPAALTMGHHF
jgi:hypothetical protein